MQPRVRASETFSGIYEITKAQGLSHYSRDFSKACARSQTQQGFKFRLLRLTWVERLMPDAAEIANICFFSPEATELPHDPTRRQVDATVLGSWTEYTS